MSIELQLKKSLFAPAYYPYLRDYTHRFEVYCGSAGSAKSYFITQKLIVRAANERIKILVCRRYGTTIRNTCFALFKDILTKWKLTPYIKIRETDFNISFPNGSEIIFCGLDSEEKLLSLAGIGCIFIEEATEVPKDIFEQLNLRLRGATPNQQIILAFNPISKKHWLYDFVNNPPQSFFYLHTTYLDNPFLDAAYVAQLEELKTRNPNKARVFVYGEWGVNTDLLVFSNWKVEDFDILETASRTQARNGCDFGYVDATAFICTLYDEKNKIIYVYDEWVKTGAQLDELAQAITDKKQAKVPIWCDSAEPRSIDYLKHKGFYAKPCIKGPDSVNARIAFLQNHTIIVKPNCRQFITDLENFCYIKDSNGNITDNTTHEYSHTIDACGYAFSDIYRSNRIRTINKAALGL